MGVYASHFTEVTGFQLLANPDDPSGERANPTAIIDGDPWQYHCWMPMALVGANDELIMSYLWRDMLIDDSTHDSEIYVQQWDAVAGNWTSYGRGGNSNGNDVFGGPQNSAGYFSEDHLIYAEAEVQLGLIDYDSDPTTEMDLIEANGEHVFLYNRQTDSWSLLDPPGGYGTVFDLKGEPEVEFNVAGAPLLAYIDTDVFSATYGQPFVLRWSGGAWNVIGSGPASPYAGLTPFDGMSTGITVQAGPNGSVFLGYLAFDGTSIDVYTRYWNGTSWQNAGPETEIAPGQFVSTVPEGSILQAVYYADFDAFNFDDVDLTEIDLDQDGNRDPGFDEFNVGEWYFDELFVIADRRDWMDTEIEATAGQFYVEVPDGDDIEDNALVTTITVPENELAGYSDATSLQSRTYHQFRLIGESHVIIEMMYAMDAMNMDMDVYLMLDGAMVDADASDDIPLTPVSFVLAGMSKTWDQGDFTTITLDTSLMADSTGQPLDPLAAGEHYLALRTIAEVSCPDLGPDNYGDPDDPERRFTFPAGAAADLDGWSFQPDLAAPATTTGVWDADAGSGGVGDGGLLLTIDENNSGNTTFSAYFQRSFTLFGGGQVSVELAYAMDPTGMEATDNDTLDLQVVLVDPQGNLIELNTLGTYQATNSTGLVAYNTITVDSTAAGTLAAGNYTLRVMGLLTNATAADDSVGIIQLDDIVITTTDEVLASDFDNNPQMEGWGYHDITDPGLHVNGAWAAGANLAGPGGGLEMTLGIGVNQANLQGAFSYDFNYGGPVTLEFDYQLIVDANVPANATLVLLVAIDGEYITRSLPDTALPAGDPRLDLEYIVVTADGAATQSEADSVSITLEGLNNAIAALDALASGGHTITIEGLLSQSGTGVGTLRFDNFRLFGIDADDDDVDGEIPEWQDTAPHRAHLRVDNFSVYQRVVPIQQVDDTEGLISTEGPFDFDALVGVLPVGWSYLDRVDPSGVPGEVVGVQDDNAGVGGVGDGALVMTLGDNATMTNGLEGRFTYTFTLTQAAFLDVDWDYYLETDANIGAYETLDLTVSLERAALPGIPLAILHTEQLVASGGASHTAGWQTLETTGVGQAGFGIFSADNLALSAGSYNLVFNAELSRSGHVHTNLNGSTTDVPGQAFLKIDDVTIRQYEGAGRWESEDAGGDTGSEYGAYGSNDAVGPDPNIYDNVREGAYDFGECIHSQVAGIGSQSYVIEDVMQYEGGDMVIGFRYRLDSVDPQSVSVLVDGVEYNNLQQNAPITTDIQFLYGWWNYIRDDAEYSYVTVTAEEIAAGAHTVAIQLNSLFAQQCELYIDNLFILATPVINAIMPQATLLPTGQDGERHFAVALNSQSPNVLVYENGDDVYADGLIASYTEEFLDGYHAASVFELDINDNSWQRYGDLIEATTNINFFVDTENRTLSGAAFNLPSAELYRIEDIIVGPYAVAWVALQHATAEWVDAVGDDGVNDRADVHPWDTTSDLWSEPTDLDIFVWRWVPFNDPQQVQGDAQFWLDTGFAPIETAWAYSDIELIGSGGQLPTVAWTNRANLGGIMNGYAQRYESDGTWGVLNTENAQNNEFWSSMWVRDMIVREDGMPILSYYTGHLTSDCIREFRRSELLPTMVVSEFSGIQDDNILEFGVTQNISTDQSFSISNAGPGDLVIYDIEIGGYGSLAASPFSLRNVPQFPTTLEPGDQEAVVVRFNPAGVPAGEYQAVLVLHTNDVNHPTHPYTHFEEILLTVVVTNGAEVTLETDWLEFEDTIVGQSSAAQEVIVANQGTGPLTISQWFFDDNNYQITEAFITSPNPGGGTTVTPVTTTNIADAADDVAIGLNSTLTLRVIFAPDTIGIFNDTMYIRTNDVDEPFLAVALTGDGVSGAQIVVEENSGTASNDDLVDFGSVIMGTSSSPIPIVIRNAGTTNLEISDIFVGANAISVIEIDPILLDPIVLGPGESTFFEIIFSPTSQSPTGVLEPEELETSLYIISDDEVIPTYEVSVLGLAVPTIPLIEITENSGSSATDQTLEFGVVNVGQIVTQTFTIHNIGGADLVLKSFLINQLVSPFTLAPVNGASSADDIVLAPNASQVVTVTYAPSTVGFIQQVIQVRSNNRDDPNAIHNVILQGSAINPVLTITDSSGDQDDRHIDYGVIGQNLSSMESVFLTNQGDSPVTLTGWTSSSSSFVIQPSFTTPVILAAGQQMELHVTFTPGSASAFAGTVTITSTDPTNPSWIVTLAGQGAAPGTALITDTETASPHGVIEFATALGHPLVAGLDTSVEEFTITNIGASNLVIKGVLITSIYGSGAPASWSSVELTSSPFTLSIAGTPVRNRLDPNSPADDRVLAPNESLDVLVTFAPYNKFDGQVWATIVTNDPAESQPDQIAHVLLTGESIYALQAGQVAGAGQPKPVFYDDNGDKVQVKVTGGGYAVVILRNGAGTGSDIERIELVQTTEKSSLIVTAQGFTSIGQIVGDAAKNIVLKNAVLDGDGITGDSIQIGALAGKIMANGLINGADIAIDSVSGKGAKLLLGQAEDGCDLDVLGPVSLLKLDGWGNGTIHATRLDKLQVGQEDFNATVQVDETLKSASLASWQIGAEFWIADDLVNLSAPHAAFSGILSADSATAVKLFSIQDGILSLREHLQSLTVANGVADSRVMAGYDLATDTLLPGGDIAKVTVNGQFANSFVSAGIAPESDLTFFDPAFNNDTSTGTIGNVVFDSVLWSNNSVPFGVAAHNSIDLVKVGNTTYTPGAQEVDFRVLLI
ncbi:MAG: choice-of-anchor D domain-containing protein [Sedimentisphaerales bacterium]|nr:choice-of-anchor D domain-containing protein [Sedimentisphaerales bacterium]